MGVMKTGEAFWAKDYLFYLGRHGGLEETYFDVSYDPVRGETGAVAGVFCIVSETTGRVIGERRLRTLSRLGANMSAAKTTDAICRAAAETLSRENPADLPYALFYAFDGESQLDLICSYGAAPGEKADRIDLLSNERRVGPFAQVCKTGLAVEALAEGPMAQALSPSASERMLILPLTSGNALVGFLVAGVSRFLPMEGSYRDFLGLVAGQVSIAIATVQALEAERKRTEALAELDRAKTAFFSNVSHEFRTPLTLMLGPIEDALSDKERPLPPEQRERVELLHRNALRLLKLVNTLLDFSRIEAGRLQAVYAPTDLASFTADLASVFRSAIEKAGLRLIVDCPPAPAPVYVDREMWEKIVLNLLSNAFKFTFEGEIKVALRWTEDRVVLKVRDTGTGIPQAELPHLFERFHRVKGARARTHEGSGIGLALVQELVRLHGGTIGAESKVDRGTTFTVTIPTGTAHLPADRIGGSRTEASTAIVAAPYVEEALRWLPQMRGEEALLRPVPHPARILLADDNADMREYIKRILLQHWTVEAVEDGAAALASARERTPDLVLTDVMMPEMNGFELLQALRADLRTREVPVIVLSARAGEESRVEGLEAGADDYLIKPFSARELTARVGAHLELARLRRETLRSEQKLRLEAEEANRLKSQFFSSVSHDLRTPLNAIVGYIYLLMSETYGPVADSQKTPLDGIQRNVRELLRLINDVLDLARIDSGKMSVELSSVRLSSIIEAITIEMKPLLEMRSLSLQSRIPENLPDIESDAAKIKQIITNLISNAVKFTNEGGVKIEVGELPEEGGVEIAVSDTGMGIEPDLLPKIFESFYQIEESRAFGGSGLGLTIVKELVGLLQGEVRVASEVGKGSTFTIFLPYRIVPSKGEAMKDALR
jgi:signal transduction histidine kinase